MEIQQEESGGGWTSPPSPPPSNSWPTFPPTHFPSDTDLHYSSAEVQAWAVGNQMQLKVVHQVKKFFNSQEDDTDEDSDEDSDTDDEIGDDDDSGGGDYLGFFSKLFDENKELREYYINDNNENGEFGCLVCGGVGFIKRFKECVALVQHTLSISNNKKKIKAHRDFGHVLCKVLAWNINKLPSITSTKSQQQQVHQVTEADNVEGLGKGTGFEKGIAAHGALAPALPEVDGTSIATKLRDNAPNIEQGSIEGSLDCHEEHCKEDGSGKSASEDNQ